jgi:hypothetical protein
LHAGVGCGVFMQLTFQHSHFLSPGKADIID